MKDKVNSIEDNTISNGEKTNYEYAKTSSYYLLVNSFINYFICDRVYLVAGIGGAYNVSDSKYRIKLTSTYESGSLSVTKKYGEICYAIKHAVVPKIGIGIKCTKRLSLEFCVFDQLTKIEYDLSPLYKMSIYSDLARLCPDIKDVIPDTKQSVWINRFGIVLGIRGNITNNFFVKSGISFRPPRDVVQKNQSETLTLYSIGCDFTIGYVF